METLRQSTLAMMQTLAVMQQSHAQHEREMAQLRRESEENKRAADERFARIEAILMEHNRILSRLADTVGEKIGFKASLNPA
jgi:hypothetical protein